MYWNVIYEVIDKCYTNKFTLLIQSGPIADPVSVIYCSGFAFTLKTSGLELSLISAVADSLGQGWGETELTGTLF